MERILVFCAHPDDEIIGVGGTLAKYAQEKKKVTVVIFSSGENFPFWLKKEHTIKEREKETKKAGQILGVHETIFLGLRDLSLKDDLNKKEVFSKVVAIIKKIKPHQIFTHYPGDVFFNHDAVGKFILKAIKKANYTKAIYMFKVWNPFYFGKRQNPKLIIDISSMFVKKIKALDVYESQKLVIYMLYPFIFFKAVFEGIKYKTKYVETFLRYG